MGHSRPRDIPDVATGLFPVPGRVDELSPVVVRLTAPNPGMMTGPGTNSYLVGRSNLAVIDPGPRDDAHIAALLEVARVRGGIIRWVLVTHTHADHAPGAADLAKASGAEIIGFDDRDGFSPDHAVDEGWVTETPDFTLRAVHTPGHASNHLCWLLEESGMLFSGDHVMQGSTVVIRPPDGEMGEYLASLDRLRWVTPEVRSIAPGHGRIIARPRVVLDGIIRHRIEREAMVAIALAEHDEATVDALLPEVYADVPARLLPVARFSLWAHLRHLATQDRAQCSALIDGKGLDLDALWRATNTTSEASPEAHLGLR